MISNFIIDPPWSVQKARGALHADKSKVLLDYVTLSVVEIFKLLDAEVLSQAAEKHNVFLWTTDAYLTVAESMMTQRGYTLHARFIWDKGNGVPAAFTVRYSHEYLIWFYFGGLIPVSTETRGKYPTVFYEKKREHSRKPEEAYDMIQAMYPDLTRMDVFGREPREGWLIFGNETTHFAKRPDTAATRTLLTLSRL